MAWARSNIGRGRTGRPRREPASQPYVPRCRMSFRPVGVNCSGMGLRPSHFPRYNGYIPRARLAKAAKKISTPLKYSEYFIPTLRDVPAEAELVSHQLLLRAGYVRKLSAGVYTLLPLGWRVVQKIERVLREGDGTHRLRGNADADPSPTRNAGRNRALECGCGL